MQVKLVEGKNAQALETNLNEFLSTLTQNPTSIKYDFAVMTAVVEYETMMKGAICCDCRFWDDNGDNLIGLCQRCGGRKRFSEHACNCFVDIRR